MPKITLAEFFAQDCQKLINCYTREQSETIRLAFHAMGKTWGSGSSYLDLDFWEETDRYRHYTNNGRTGINPDIKGYAMYEFDDVLDFFSKPESEPESELESNPNQLRVLLRSDYRWYNADWDGQSKLFSINGNVIVQTDIISIENDPRGKYVQCTKCGSIIKKTKKAIEAHAQLGMSSKTCLTCKYLKSYNETEVKESFVKNDDGTYIRTRNATCSLGCGNAYRKTLIDSPEARDSCMYRRCGLNTIQPISDFFTKYPGAFDDMATVDALDMNKWEMNYKSLDNSASFRSKGRYNIYIHTTNLGIIDRFECNYRSNHYTMAYSKKYDKIFVFKYGEYSEPTATGSGFSTQYYNALMQIMRNIYKGEN